MHVKCFKSLIKTYSLVVFLNEDFNKATFIANRRHCCCKVNFDNNNNCDEVDPDTTIHVKILCWHSKFEKRKALKKDE